MDNKLANILLIDESQTVLDDLIVALHHGPYNLKTTNSGVMAMDDLYSGKYDVIIISISMPDVDGMVLTHIAKESNPESKVIITTPKASLEMTVEALNQGADDFVVKPFEDLAEIANKTERALQLKRLAAEKEQLLRDLKQTNAQLESAKAEIEKWNKELEKKVEARTLLLEQSRKKIQQYADELKIKNEELKKLDSLKTDFLANVSHELKTPLTAILGYSEIFLTADETHISSQFKEFSKMIHDSGKQLYSLIKDLLYFSELEKGNMVLIRTDCNINEVIQSAINEIWEKAEKKNISIHFDINKDVPLLYLDVEKTALAITKLLDNSVKFDTENGNIWITTHQENGSVVVYIKDDGEGIPEKSVGYIFERFRQGDGTSTREHGGVGMGLTMAKEIITMQNGRLWLAETQVGKGCTFAVSFPINQTEISQKEKFVQEKADQNEEVIKTRKKSRVAYTF